jgi:hypothetical protein
MRSSVVPLVVSVGAMLALPALSAAPAKAADVCCGCIEAPGAAAFGEPKSEVKVFEESKPEAPEAAPPAASPQPTPLDIEAEGLVIGNTYGDVFRALKDDNTCSRFFGGPRVAVTVLNQLTRRVRRRSLGARNVGLVMSGDYTWYQDARSGASYRLFDEAAINSNGPFAVVPPPTAARFSVGRFPAASREARALMLLHELGHLVRGKDGWLLPNDGGDAALSDRNTRKVEERCLKELLSLRD